MARIMIRLMTGMHRLIYRLSGGRIGGGTMNGLQIVFLTTTGRRTGKLRTTPLTVLVDGEHWVAIASNGGRPVHPAWYRNLVANPAVSLEIRRERIDAIARSATPEERAFLWPRITQLARNYAGYQEKTTREIPLVILERPERVQRLRAR